MLFLDVEIEKRGRYLTPALTLRNLPNERPNSPHSPPRFLCHGTSQGSLAPLLHHIRGLINQHLDCCGDRPRRALNTFANHQTNKSDYSAATNTRLRAQTASRSSKAAIVLMNPYYTRNRDCPASAVRRRQSTKRCYVS